jgi:hypothetical protein
LKITGLAEALRAGFWNQRRVIAMDNVLTSYLVNLGFSTDQAGLARFNASLRDAEAMTKRMTMGMVKGFVEVGAAVTAAYASVGAATLGMLDKVAQGEMSYELLGMKMYMSADAAKKMSIATQALGHDLSEIAYNPTLSRWYGELNRDQDAMQAGLGGNEYKKNVAMMQEIGEQFTRMNVEGQYFMMGLSSAIMKQFGGGGDVLAKLKGLNDWIIASLPRWSEMVANYLVPVLKDGVAIGKDLLGIGQDLASIFEQFIGVLYNDAALKSGKVNFENFGIAVKDVSGDLRYCFDELKKLTDLITEHPELFKIATGMVLGSPFGPAGTVIGGGIGSVWSIWDNLKGNIGTVPLPKNPGAPAVGATSGGSGITADQAKAMAYDAATRHGVDPAIFMAMIEKESNWNPNAKSPKSTASGLGQLIAGTAKDMGVTNVFDPYQNLEGSASYLAQLLNLTHKNYANALAFYGEGPSYAADILDNRRGHYENYRPSSITINSTTGDVHVHVTQPNASADEIAHKTAAVVREQTRLGVQRTIVGLSGNYA